jgi:hypothetical protein
MPPSISAQSRRGPPSGPRHGTFLAGRAFGRASASTSSSSPRVFSLRKRLLKYLRRLLYLVLLVGVIGVAAFTWFCYWPLEGKVGDLLTIVPENAEFVIRGDWEDIERTGWIQKNLLEDPLHPLVQTEVAKGLTLAKAQMADLEGQINANIPLEFARFHVVEDVLKGEVVVSGHWCPGSGPDNGPPKWQELLIMTRVSWKTRCVAALKHGFIRDQLGAQLQVTPEADEVFKLTFPFMPVLPERERAICGGGFIIPPQNVWYLRRVKDVLAISNSERMIRGVANLSKDLSGTGSFAGRPGFDIAPKPGKVVAAVNVQPLHTYFKRAFLYWPYLKTLGRFIPPEALEKLSGYFSLNGEDLLEGGAKLSYFSQQEQAQEVYANVYALAQSSVREGIASLVPAKDTYGVISLRVDPYYLLMNLVNDAMTSGDRALWESNMRKERSQGGFEYSSIEDLIRDLSSRVGDHAMVAVARLSSEFDKIEHEEIYSEYPKAREVFAVMVRIKEGGNQAELDEYMSKVVPVMGFERDLQRVKYGNYTYSRAKLSQTFLDFAHLSPCFVLAKNYLILTNNEAYMRLVLDAVTDPQGATLASDPTFRETMGALPETGQVGIFVDLEKYTRIPPPDREGAGAPGTRGFLWDQRNSKIQISKDTRDESIRYRSELHKKYGVPRTAEEEDKIEDMVSARMDLWERDLYPSFEEEYRLDLEQYRRLRGAGIVLGADAETINAHFSVTFREGETWLHWAR